MNGDKPVSWYMLTALIVVAVFCVTATTGIVIWLNNNRAEYQRDLLALRAELRAENVTLESRIRRNERALDRARLDAGGD